LHGGEVAADTSQRSRQAVAAMQHGQGEAKKDQSSSHCLFLGWLGEGEGFGVDEE
jgi:hypothetical protein